MKLLGVSDIHGNVEAVRQLREREGNEFDAVVVAGDIGSEAAPNIMGILASFACPVMYVFGNWDAQLPYRTSFGAACHHLHLQSVECGNWGFAGFSGLPMQWGMNPMAAAVRQDLEHRHQAVLDAYTEALTAAKATVHDCGGTPGADGGAGQRQARQANEGIPGQIRET